MFEDEFFSAEAKSCDLIIILPLLVVVENAMICPTFFSFVRFPVRSCFFPRSLDSSKDALRIHVQQQPFH